VSGWSVRSARARIAELDAEIAGLEREGERLVADFRERFPDSPAYLAKYADRTLTGWRWRRSSARRWRGDRPARVNRTFDLTGDEGRSLLRGLPAGVRASWLRFERRRADLNLAYALARYERTRLQDWLSRRAVLTRLEEETP